MMRALWKQIGIVAGLLLLLTYLLLQSRTPDLELRARMHEALQSFALHDAELTRDVLLARAGLLPNYDSLGLAGQSLARDLQALREESLTASEATARTILGHHVQVLATAAQEKAQAVDYFKSDNALLRNSLMYLTQARALVRAKLTAEKSVAEEMGHLSHALLRFLQSPDSGVGLEIQGVLDRLSALTRSDGEFQLVVMHGRFIVDKLPEVDTLMRQIISSPTVLQASALQEAVLQYAGRVEGRAQTYRFGLYLVAVTLLAYLIHQFLRLRANAEELRATNVRLNCEMGERQQAEVALRASEERLRAITDSAKEAIVSADSAGNIVSWNAGATAIFGYRPEQMLGTSFTRLLPDRVHEARARTFGELILGGRADLFDGTTEIAGLRKDGTEFPLEVSLSTWTAQRGRYITSIMRDITERRHLEETTRQQELQLIQANKMTALGTLVSSVAHEINNPNQLVLMNSRVLAEAWDDALDILDDFRTRNGEFLLSGLPYSEIRQSIATLTRDVHDGALRIDRIVDDLKNFARPPAKGVLAMFELNDVVQRATRLLGHLINKRTARFAVDLASDLPALLGNAQQVEQVVVNLLGNALEALPDRDHGVSVKTLHQSADRRAVLEVRDEGVGIPPQNLARLCDPFFTTKQASGGTGLGLAITASLVRAHGGTLEFESEPGRGTCSRAIFPLVRAEAAISEPTVTAQPA